MILAMMQIIGKEKLRAAEIALDANGNLVERS
jgi:hypothetical protein